MRFFVCFSAVYVFLLQRTLIALSFVLRLPSSPRLSRAVLSASAPLLMLQQLLLCLLLLVLLLADVAAAVPFCAYSHLLCLFVFFRGSVS